MEIKMENVNQTLPLILQIMRARADEYYKSWMCNHDHADYTAYWTYSSCACLLAEALDGNFDVILQWIGASELPDLPTEGSWVDWNANVRIDTACKLHAAKLHQCPCERCAHVDECDADPHGQLSCQEWVEWNAQNKT